MSNSSWSEQLARKLTTLVKKIEAGGGHRLPRIIILGIGNELNGDDAAGIEVIRRLRSRLEGLPNLLLVDGGAAPENSTGPIRRFAPDLVIMIDCADMEANPGQVAWLDMADLDGLSASTHTLPPTVLAKFLQSDLDCEIGLIGVQPESLEFGAPLSHGGFAAVDQIAAEIIRHFPLQNDVLEIQ